METLLMTAIRFGVDVTWKATLLLALALGSMAALRRASAAFRHLASFLALAGVLALPALTLLAPPLAVPFVPGFLSAVPSSVVRTRITTAGGSPLAPRSEPADASAVPASSVVSCSNVTALSQRAWPLWAIAIWASGALLSFVRLAFGVARVRAIVRLAEPLSDAGCIDAASEICRRLGLHRRVRVVMSSEVPVAMTIGAWRPVVLLSSTAPDWPEEFRRAVLLHELAHVRRCDWITFLLGELAVAVYWFHPLAWLARRETRSNAERACDDRVIGDGTRPSAYAAHLLDVVRSFAPGNATLPAMAMAHSSQFEGRVRAILDPDRRRRELTGWHVRGAAVGLLAVVGGIAAIAPAAAHRAGGATARLAVAPVPLAIVLPSVSQVSAAPSPAKTECKTKAARTAAKGKCRKKPVGASAPRVSS